MSYEERWEHIRKLGVGGQGEVSLVRDTSLYKLQPLSDMFVKSLNDLSGVKYKNRAQEAFKELRTGIIDIVNAESPENQGALKKLHPATDARDPERAGERIVREIQAMAASSHPSLLRILDSDPEARWFVSEFHPNGVLGQKPDMFKGDLNAALRAFRPLVAGVASLHQDNLVHRDIKPANVFLSLKNELVLGDFGLVYFSDDSRTRVSGTFENVGTRDWMAPWAMGRKLDDIKPSHDVFALGKLLWSMLSGQRFLQLWYFDEEEFDVERMFPNARNISLANALFRKTIVEKEKDCMPDAGALLEEVDRLLCVIDLRADLIRDNIKRRCKVCGLGMYNCIVDLNQTGAGNFGLNPRGSSQMKIFTCAHCGHVQLFHFQNEKGPPAWKREASQR